MDDAGNSSSVSTTHYGTLTAHHANSARISVVIVTDHYETIRLVLGKLAQQTVSEQIEVVIVVPAGVVFERGAGELARYGLRMVEVDDIRPLSRARAAGVRAATAPVIFLGETHSFPHPEFAAALIDAHENAWDVVVPGLGNANPDGALSWAAFLMDYGQWLEDLPGGMVAGGPTWNTSYKRAVLLDVGDRLERVLSSGDELPLLLRARGSKVFFEPRARIGHTNVARNGWIDERYLAGLLIGANRRGMWSPAKRFLYVCASPIIPAVILSRIARSVGLLTRRGTLPAGSIPALLVGAIVRTAGEVVGYIRGAAPAATARMEEYELHKLSYTVKPLTEASIAG